MVINPSLDLLLTSWIIPMGRRAQWLPPVFLTRSRPCLSPACTTFQYLGGYTHSTACRTVIKVPEILIL